MYWYNNFFGAEIAIFRDNKVNPMGLLPDTLNWGLCMRRECRERFPLHRLQRKPLVSDPGMHHGTCVGIANLFPVFPAHAQPAIFTYLARGPWLLFSASQSHQFPWYWLYWANLSSSAKVNIFNYVHHIGFDRNTTWCVSCNLFKMTAITI